MSDELFRTLCANLANKITNMPNQSNEQMEEIKVEEKFKKEKWNSENNSEITPVDDENSSSKTENLSKISVEKCTSSQAISNDTQNYQNDENEFRKSQISYQERYERFQEYKKIEKSLCLDLGMSTKYDKYEILTPKRMEKCRKNLQKLYLLKKKRELHYAQIIDEIKTLLSEMEIYTWSDFEKSALSTQFAVTVENLNALHAWKVRLLEQWDQEQKTVEEMKSKIANLWEKVPIDVKTRQEFLSQTFTKRSRKHVLNSLQMEVHRCQKLWKQKIRHEVLNMRKEIINLWVECHVCEKRREQFVAFNSEIFDEELLIAHQHEATRLKQQYQETLELNKMAFKWVDLRSKLTELEINSKSFKKYNNRGGSLLKGEKELKKCQKNISTLESKIIHLSAKYKTDHESHFYFSGRPISQLIDESRKNTTIEKENKVRRNQTTLSRESVPLKSRENISLSKNSRSYSFCKPKISNLTRLAECSLKI